LWSTDSLAPRSGVIDLYPYRTYVVLEHRDGSPLAIRNYPGVGLAGIVFTRADAAERFIARVCCCELASRSTTGDRVAALFRALAVDGIVVDPFDVGACGVFA
jgi:hypothetical protein